MSEFLSNNIYVPAFVNGISQKQKDIAQDFFDDGQDINNIFAHGKIWNLSKEKYSDEELDDLLYYLKVDMLKPSDFSSDQWKQISDGINKKLDVSIYAKKELSPVQMQILRKGLENNKDLKTIKLIAIPGTPPEKMKRILGLDKSDYPNNISIDNSDFNKNKQVFHSKNKNLFPTDKKNPFSSVGEKYKNGLYRYYLLKLLKKNTYLKCKQTPHTIKFFKLNYTVFVNNIRVWGFVEYDIPITLNQCNNFFLMPASPKIKIIKSPDEYKKSVIVRIKEFNKSI